MKPKQSPRTFTDPFGTEYEAVTRVSCDGCAFDKGKAEIHGMFSFGCYNSPNCNANSNGGKSIIWVRVEARGAA